MEYKEFEIKNYPIIPVIFIKGCVQNSFSKKDFYDKLDNFSKIHSYKTDELKYFFTKESLKHNLFFNIDENIREQLLYDAIHWAALNESRSKIRPKSYSEIKDGKHNAFFTQLQKDFIKSFFNNYNISNPNFDFFLGKYLNLFFELACIKRNRT